MSNVLTSVLTRGNWRKYGLSQSKNILNLIWFQKNSERFFSKGSIYYLGSKNNRNSKKEKQLPTLFCIQNPILWLINKIDFKMLKSAWDSDFDEEEFKRGTRQAVAVICTLISKNLWDSLRGLVTRQALVRLQRDVEVNWSDEQRRNINMTPEDIKHSLPLKIHFLRIADQKFVNIDMSYFVIKFKDEKLSISPDVVLIEIIARFHRNYTLGQLPNWTMLLLKNCIRFMIMFKLKKGHLT